MRAFILAGNMMPAIWDHALKAGFNTLMDMRLKGKWLFEIALKSFMLQQEASSKVSK